MSRRLEGSSRSFPVLRTTRLTLASSSRFPSSSGSELEKSSPASQVSEFLNELNIVNRF